MEIHIQPIAGQKPLILVILDMDETEPTSTAAIKTLLMDVASSVPKDKKGIKFVRRKAKDT